MRKAVRKTVDEQRTTPGTHALRHSDRDIVDLEIADSRVPCGRIHRLSSHRYEKNYETTDRLFQSVAIRLRANCRAIFIRAVLSQSLVGADYPARRSL